MRDDLVFNPRKMSVAMVEAELAKHPDLTIDQLKAMLAHEGTQVRPRQGVERALDARLLALAEEAIEAAADDMVAEGAPEAELGDSDAGQLDEDAPMMEAPADPIDAMTDAEIARQPGETITEHVGRMAEAQGIEPKRMLGTHAVLVAAAMLAHETNRAYCAILGDDSQTSWDDAPQWQRDSAFAGVTAIHRDPATTPEQSHEGWLAQKQADGWRWGEVKDADAKTHPCFMPYEDLPENQRLKDSLFGFVVRLILGLEPVAEDTPEGDQSSPLYDDHAIAANTPVHVTMTNGEVHEGYYVKEQPGAMIRMRDGQDTVIFVPDQSFWVSPSDEDESGD